MNLNSRQIGVLRNRMLQSCANAVPGGFFAEPLSRLEHDWHIAHIRHLSWGPPRRFASLQLKLRNPREELFEHDPVSCIFPITSSLCAFYSVMLKTPLWLGPTANKERREMDKDRIKGAAKQLKGSAKKTMGKMTGNTKTQAKGAAEKAAGKAQNVAGRTKDAARDTLKK